MSQPTDIEAKALPPKNIPLWRQVIDKAGITQEVVDHPYQGKGTDSDPFLVTWIPNDPRDPMRYSSATKWAITVLSSFTTLAFTLTSSIYTGGAPQMIAHFKCSEEVYTLGLSLYVSGFAAGSLLWAPLSELYGRQIIFVTTFGIYVALNGATIPINSTAALIVLRFLAGATGSAPLTNVGGLIADMFAAEKRAQALSLFAVGPLLGPMLGPAIGGFISENIGWRWMFSFTTICVGVFYVGVALFVPETYAPVLLRCRAQQLSQRTGQVYMFRSDVEQGRKPPAELFKNAVVRPWVLMCKEPIVFLFSLYTAIVYGTLYMMFGAFPIVYQQERGWSQGVGGLAFLGVTVGCFIAVAYCLWDNKRYAAISRQYNGFAPPETRLPGAMLAGVLMPAGLFWFAWTCGPNVHWIVSIIAGAPFGFGLVVIFLCVFNYLVDAYTIYAASVLAANGLLRSILGAAFPLFTTQMYRNLGVHWASTIPAFLALACAPLPFLFYKYGEGVRLRCKYAAEAAAFLKRLQEGRVQAAESSSSLEEKVDEPEAYDDKSMMSKMRTHESSTRTHERVVVARNRLFDVKQAHSVEEIASFEKLVKATSAIALRMKVSQATPRSERGAFFNNLDVLGVDWQLESVTIGVMSSGRVGFVETSYDNGVILRKGVSDGRLTRKTLQNFLPGERVISAAIETGTALPVSDSPRPAGPWVLSVCLFTNRGRRLDGRGPDNEVLSGDIVRKDSTIYENVATLYVDTPYAMGGLKGFFGRVDNDPIMGGIRRLGVIWGDAGIDISTKTIAPSLAPTAPSFATRAPSLASDVFVRSTRPAVRESQMETFYCPSEAGTDQWEMESTFANP